MTRSTSGVPLLDEHLDLVVVVGLVDDADHDLGAGAHLLAQVEQPVQVAPDAVVVGAHADRLVLRARGGVEADVDHVDVQLEQALEVGLVRLLAALDRGVVQRHAVGGEVDRPGLLRGGVGDLVDELRVHERLAGRRHAQDGDLVGADLVDHLGVHAPVHVHRLVLGQVGVALAVRAVDAAEVADRGVFQDDDRRELDRLGRVEAVHGQRHRGHALYSIRDAGLSTAWPAIIRIAKARDNS
jgi:hypothetical protein